MALGRSYLRRLPLSTSLLYLLVGIGLGSAGLGLLRLDPLDDSALLERIAEVAMVVLLGSLLVPLLPLVPPSAVWFVPLLLLVIRPVAVGLGLLGSDMQPEQRALTAWFGIRGIGSVYYLMYALNHEVGGPVADEMAALTAVTIAVSIVVHGISVTPLMDRYRRLRGLRRSRGSQGQRPRP